MDDELNPLGEHERVWAAINHAIEAGGTFKLEHQVIRLDGTLGWTFLRAIPLLNEPGEIVKWFGAASEITERKQAAELLRESEERLRLSVESASIFVWEINSQTGETKYSANAAAVLGFELSANPQANFANVPEIER